MLARSRPATSRIVSGTATHVRHPSAPQRYLHSPSPRGSAPPPRPASGATLALRLSCACCTPPSAAPPLRSVSSRQRGRTPPPPLMEEAPPIDSPVAAVAESGSPQIDARDHLVTECLRAFHKSQPRMPRASSLSGFLKQTDDELNTWVRNRRSITLFGCVYSILLIDSYLLHSDLSPSSPLSVQLDAHLSPPTCCRQSHTNSSPPPPPPPHAGACSARSSPCTFLRFPRKPCRSPMSCCCVSARPPQWTRWRCLVLHQRCASTSCDPALST